MAGWRSHHTRLSFVERVWLLRRGIGGNVCMRVTTENGLVDYMTALRNFLGTLLIDNTTAAACTLSAAPPTTCPQSLNMPPSRLLSSVSVEVYIKEEETPLARTRNFSTRGGVALYVCSAQVDRNVCVIHSPAPPPPSLRTQAFPVYAIVINCMLTRRM